MRAGCSWSAMMSPQSRGWTGSVKSSLTRLLQIPRRLLSPSPFSFERLLAVFHAILPHDNFKSSMDIHTAFATLTSLRLLIKAGLGGDILEPAAKFRVNVGWDFVQRLGRNVGLEVGDWCFEG